MATRTQPPIPDLSRLLQMPSGSGDMPDDTEIQALMQRLVKELFGDDPGSDAPEGNASPSSPSAPQKTMLPDTGVMPYSDDTVRLQIFLQKMGFDVGKNGPDGLLGPDTRAALRKFEKERLPAGATDLDAENFINDYMNGACVPGVDPNVKRLADEITRDSDTAIARHHGGGHGHNTSPGATPDPGAPVHDAPCRGGNFVDFKNALLHQESGGNARIVNHFGGPIGYVGLFQMGPDALQDTGYYIKAPGEGPRHITWAGSWTGKDGINSLEDFRNHADVQHKAIETFMKKNLATMQRMDLFKHIGEVHTLPGGKTFTVTMSGLLAAAHLGGPGGVKAFFEGENRSDGNATVGRYMAQFQGYNLDGLTHGSGYAATNVADADTPHHGLQTGGQKAHAATL